MRKNKKPYTNFWSEITYGYHNDKPLYWTMIGLITFFSIVGLAVYLNK